MYDSTQHATRRFDDPKLDHCHQHCLTVTCRKYRLCYSVSMHSRQRRCQTIIICYPRRQSPLCYMTIKVVDTRVINHSLLSLIYDSLTALCSKQQRNIKFLNSGHNFTHFTLFCISETMSSVLMYIHIMPVVSINTTHLPFTSNFVFQCLEVTTRNLSTDEIANVNFLYDDILQALGNTKKRKTNS